jgi:iron complex outermembrane receptor protein
LDSNTEWQVQFVVDDRNISQPTGATSAIGDFLSYNASTYISQRYAFFGMPAVHLLGIYYNTLPNDSDTVNIKPGGNATLGVRTQNVTGRTTNYGARVREEITPAQAWTVVLGGAVEASQVDGVSTSFAPTGNPASTISANRDFTNRAFEAGLLYRPDPQWQFRGRVASGYGTPQIGNLFVTQAGVAGNNTDLQSQTNIGYDLGFDWTPARWLTLSVTGFYEFFKDELVTQSPGAGLQNFTFNAPASEHRGIEIAADWRPAIGWRGTIAYLFNDQVYTDYVERLSAGALSNAFDRVGNKIPGNSPHELLARFGYEQAFGAFKGLGAYAEYQWKDAFYMDNGNHLKAPGYDLVNLNVHYTPEISSPYFSGLTMFAEVRNVFDQTYIASANNIANSLNGVSGLENSGSVLANSTGSIYAGMPRTLYGGFRVKF